AQPGEDQDLEVEAEARPQPQQAADQAGGDAEPKEHEPGQERLGDRQRAAERPPVPVLDRAETRDHSRSPPLAAPFGRPMASRAISPMPPSEPSSEVASSGKNTTFWFGELANLPKASTYFCATK